MPRTHQKTCPGPYHSLLTVHEFYIAYFRCRMVTVLELRAEGGRKPPTSRDDSLVVVRVKVEGRKRWKATNESQRLVGGLFGQPEGRGRREMVGYITSADHPQVGPRYLPKNTCRSCTCESRFDYSHGSWRIRVMILDFCRYLWVQKKANI